MQSNLKEQTAGESGVAVFKSGEHSDLTGTLLEFCEDRAVFVTNNDLTGLKRSDKIRPFRIILNGEERYGGGATVSNTIVQEATTICEVELENSWHLDAVIGADEDLEVLDGSFDRFLANWTNSRRLNADYQGCVVEMRSFLSELKNYLNSIEISIAGKPQLERDKLAKSILDHVGPKAIRLIDHHFGVFERVAVKIPREKHQAHRRFMRELIHPFVLGAPFPERTFRKPLGHAGDYDMVRMIADNAYSGPTMYDKVINKWFVEQPPAEAHRNRLRILDRYLVSEAARTTFEDRRCSILSVGSGPAVELQHFLKHSPLSDQADFFLLDFDEASLAYAREKLEKLAKSNNRQTRFEFIEKSVSRFLKESMSKNIKLRTRRYDLIYCAGLFDYLSDTVCSKLMNYLYDLLLPGGLLVATNVEKDNPLRHGMEHLLDWFLIYRDAKDCERLLPEKAPFECRKVSTDISGVNVFLEARYQADDSERTPDVRNG